MRVVDAPTADELRALHGKYAALVRLRERRDVTPPTAELRALARAFPGALRELRRPALDELVRRRDAAGRAADGDAPSPGSRWWSGTTRSPRGLDARRRAPRADDAPRRRAIVPWAVARLVTKARSTRLSPARALRPTAGQAGAVAPARRDAQGFAGAGGAEPPDGFAGPLDPPEAPEPSPPLDGLDVLGVLDDDPPADSPPPDFFGDEL